MSNLCSLLFYILKCIVGMLSLFGELSDLAFMCVLCVGNFPCVVIFTFILLYIYIVL